MRYFLIFALFAFPLISMAQSKQDDSKKREAVVVSPDERLVVQDNVPPHVKRDTVFVTPENGRYQVDLSSYEGQERPIIIIQVDADNRLIKKDDE